MGRGVKRGGTKRRVKYQFKQNALKRKWKKSKEKKSLSKIKCFGDTSSNKKTLKENMDDIGLVYDLNKGLNLSSEQQNTSSHRGNSDVVKALEKAASMTRSKTLRLSQPEIRFCVYMMEKYHEDYEGMSRDPSNFDQLTPAQIKRKIGVFKSIPAQYSGYLRAKGVCDIEEAQNSLEQLEVDESN